MLATVVGDRKFNTGTVASTLSPVRVVVTSWRTPALLLVIVATAGTPPARTFWNWASPVRAAFIAPISTYIASSGDSVVVLVGTELSRTPAARTVCVTVSVTNPAALTSTAKV